MGIPFYKYHGTGNDFVILDQRDDVYITANDTDQIRLMCDRHMGIGADGLMIIEPSDTADFTMIYFNSDGHQSTMCGNGGRCIAHLAYRLGLWSEQGTFEAIDGLHHVKWLGDGTISLEMIDVDSIKILEDGIVLDTGSPHFIKMIPEASSIDVYQEGRELRYDGRFAPDGLNVNFVEILSQHQIKVRTYERGVEHETLSCGTGVTAAAIAYADQHESPETKEEVQIITPGGTLSVSFVRSGKRYTNVWLTGPATPVFEGRYE